MMLRSRLGHLEGLPMFGPKTIIISPTGPVGPDLAPGTVLPWENDEGANLFVPAEFSNDSPAGLDDRQRAMIRPGDTVILLTYEDLGDGSARFGEDRITWGETSAMGLDAR